ncbi:Arabinose operon regulatory protein [Vibrio thalassae]|uniref:Arabinose operon regulatory protein n=1 Tax=Vibrio thalassae TaxID=1243014 RepID=A0A240ENQ9_9VIBR|nr:AraC family transcriptional regulator [Vibrio thalassae]SNX50151.1 Arabinose operon regulatory protein [Vibrio thalassae]
MQQISYLSSPIPDINLISGYYKEFAFQKHYHLDYHFGLIVNGQQQFNLKGQSYTCGPGDLVLMPPDELHDGQARFDEGYEVKVLAVSPHWLSRLKPNNHQGQLGFHSPIVQEPRLFRALLNTHLVLSNNKFCALARDSLPYESFEQLLGRYARGTERDRQPIGTKQLAQVRDYVMSYLDQPIRLGQLAALCDLSERQFHRLFKQATGMSPHAWLTRLRLEKSLSLVKAGKPAAQVALQTGFYDQAHFSRTFRSVYGISPSKIN